jgi:hypothetical protein
VAFPIKSYEVLKNESDLQVANDVAEDVTDNRAKQQENSNYHDGHKYQDQGVLYQTLTFFTRQKQHVKAPPSVRFFGTI